MRSTYNPSSSASETISSSFLGSLWRRELDLLDKTFSNLKVEKGCLIRTQSVSVHERKDQMNFTSQKREDKEASKRQQLISEQIIIIQIDAYYLLPLAQVSFCATECPSPGLSQNPRPKTCNDCIHFLHEKIISCLIKANPTPEDYILRGKEM